jgi:NAD(P)-dependent dehydrogenase (short-subunit alcohol dehydrogenase family)
MRTKALVALGITAGIVSHLIRSRAHFRLNGKVVFVTGGSRGLGLLLAKEFAKHGARVAICARDPEELQKAKTLIKVSASKVLTIQADMTIREEAEFAWKKSRASSARSTFWLTTPG